MAISRYSCPRVPRCRAKEQRSQPAPQWGWEPPGACPGWRCLGGPRGGGIARCCISMRVQHPHWGGPAPGPVPILGAAFPQGWEAGVPPAVPSTLTPSSAPHSALSPDPTPQPHSHPPAPAWPPRFPAHSPLQPRSFHIVPWQQECLPPPHPQPPRAQRSGAGLPPGHALPARTPRAPPAPQNPHFPPGCPSPAPGEVGLCTHPLPAAVALSLETGSDSGSITFSALSLSGNFCGNPSEKGEQAGLWVHPSQELSSLPL